MAVDQLSTKVSIHIIRERFEFEFEFAFVFVLSPSFFWLHFYTLLETHQIELHTKNKTFDSKIRFAKTNWWFILGEIERESVRKSAERSIIYHDPPFVRVCLDHIQIECFNIHAKQQQRNTHF